MLKMSVGSDIIVMFLCVNSNHFFWLKNVRIIVIQKMPATLRPYLAKTEDKLCNFNRKCHQVFKQYVYHPTWAAAF